MVIPTMREKIESAFASAGVMANAYIPAKFKQVLIELCSEVDRLRNEVKELRSTQK